MPQVGGVDVSRETIERLEVYVALITKWNKSINLVAKSTIPDLWDRHIVDSAQLLTWDPPEATSWIDVGSGGGLPGIVIAAILKEKAANSSVTLVESDQRKAAFLRTAAATLNLKINIKAERAESLPPANAGVLSARALMSLDGLLALGQRHVRPEGCILLLKGRSYQEEINAARQNWHFDVVERPSITDNEAKMLMIRNVQRATA